jgi:hypothetical protein
MAQDFNSRCDDDVRAQTGQGRTEEVRTRKERVQWRGGIGGKLFVLTVGKIS